MTDTLQIRISDGKLIHDLSITSGRCIAECARFFLSGEASIEGARAMISKLRIHRETIDAIDRRAQDVLPIGDGLRNG